MSRQTAIITGVSSFVGCHVAKTFAQAGWNTIAVTSRDVSTYEGIRAERLAYIQDDVDFAVCDLMNADALKDLIAAHDPDVWVQHAGYADNYASLDYDLEKSLGLNVVALEPLYRLLAEKDCGVIVTGSSMEYASSDDANREDDVCWPEFPYGVSKLAETVEASRLARQYNVPTRVARLYIPVGTFDAPGKLIDYVIEKLLAGEPVDLSPCSQKRDFLSVEDLCKAYLAMTADFERLPFDVFNVCSGEASELRTLLEKLAAVIGADPALFDFGAREMRPGEAPVSYGDNTKAREILGWAPGNIETALAQLVDQKRDH